MVQRLRLSQDCLISSQAQKVDVIGSQGPGPDDALCIVVLFHDGGQQPSQTDTIGAHDHRLGLSLAIEICGSQLLAVSGTQLEQVSHLDTPLLLQWASAVGAGPSLFSQSDVGQYLNLEVTGVVDVGQVETLFVGSRYEVGPDLDGIVRHHPHALEPHR